VGWLAWFLIALAVLSAGLIALGRGLQRKGRDIERHRAGGVFSRRRR
jgi:hypothetical protein